VEMLKASGSLEYAQSRASEFVAEAIAALAELEESDAKKALIETAEFVGRRARYRANQTWGGRCRSIDRGGPGNRRFRQAAMSQHDAGSQVGRAISAREVLDRLEQIRRDLPWQNHPDVNRFRVHSPFLKFRFVARCEWATDSETLGLEAAESDKARNHAIRI